MAERGLDFADAVRVFEGITVEIEDTRKDYGEKRIICFGRLEGRIVVIGYTPRGASVRHVFSMRKLMTVNKRASRRSLKFDLARVDAHVIKAAEYKELPELTEKMLSQATV